MYRAFDDVVHGGKTYADEEKISPSEVSADIKQAHELLDEIKMWAAEGVEWLEEQIALLEREDGDPEKIEKLEELKMYLNTVFMRLEYGDEHIREQAEEAGADVEEIV